MTDIISQNFDIQPLDIFSKKHISKKPKDNKELLEIIESNNITDYVYARDNILNILSNLDIITLDLFNELRMNPNPKLVDSISNLIKVYIEANQNLLKLPKQLSNKNEKSDTTPIVNQPVFVGTTEDLINSLKK